MWWLQKIELMYRLKAENNLEKSTILRRIAETAYNVGFGAKKHFATYDIVDKAPGVIGFVSMAIGIFALFIDQLNSKWLSATLIILGIAVLFINQYDESKDKYEEVGKKLTDLFNELKVLYLKVKDEGVKSKTIERNLEDIDAKFQELGISKQILFSDWYTHYKFFWQNQIKWLDEELKFSFWRDKIPLSLSVTMALIIFISSFVFISKLLFH